MKAAIRRFVGCGHKRLDPSGPSIELVCLDMVSHQFDCSESTNATSAVTHHDPSLGNASHNDPSAETQEPIPWTTESSRS